VIDATGDGLRTVDFGKVLSFIGKTISQASLHRGDDHAVQQALFGQDSWGASNAPVRGR
jgi:hypothetical protein